jgi:dihydrofolate synthase / folylpolyglutamate synthase
MTLSPALAWLYGVQLFGIKPGLENTRRLLKALQVPGSRQSVYHVAGTNGKGSVCAMMESILRTAGERTAIFTSPHLVTFGERMRVRGEAMPPEAVDAAIITLREMVRDWIPHPTFFELTLAVALDWFDRAGAEHLIMETGMGGRLDATNALTPVVSVITPIALDHQMYLGDSLAAIAREKAGIIKPGVPVVSARQAPAAEAVIREIARSVGAPLTFVGEAWEGPLPLLGRHQQENAALAVAALRAAGWDFSADTLARGLAATKWPARFERWDAERVVLDGGHNPHGVASLVETWRATFPGERATLIFGAASDKDVAASLAILQGLAARIFCVPIASARTASPEALARLSGGQAFATFEEAMAASAAFAERRLICGSLFLCGEALAHLRRASGDFQSSLQ